MEFVHAGLRCATVFHETFNSYNGYVEIRPGHPLFGLPYDNELVVAINITGGITYSRPYLQDHASTGGWWLGFDTLHIGNSAESRTEPRVADACRHVANQLNSMIVPAKSLENLPFNILHSSIRDADLCSNCAINRIPIISGRFDFLCSECIGKILKLVMYRSNTSLQEVRAILSRTPLDEQQEEFLEEYLEGI